MPRRDPAPQAKSSLYLRPDALIVLAKSCKPEISELLFQQFDFHFLMTCSSWMESTSVRAVWGKALRSSESAHRSFAAEYHGRHSSLGGQILGKKWVSTFQVAGRPGKYFRGSGARAFLEPIRCGTSTGTMWRSLSSGMVSLEIRVV